MLHKVKKKTKVNSLLYSFSISYKIKAHLCILSISDKIYPFTWDLKYYEID